MTRGERARSFGAHADAYERARPGYPLEAARWLAPGAPRLVVELGAGTGKLTRALAALEVEVLAVEPDERMLAVLRAQDLAGVRTAVGAAEAIPLEDGEAEAVVAGSSFHWFDLVRVLAEAHRVLGAGGTLAFAWNRKDDDSDPAFAAVSAAVRGDPAERWLGNRPWPELVVASGLFGEVEHATFRHMLELPRAALADFLLSYSRVAALPAEERAALTAYADEQLTTLADGDLLRLPFVVDAYRARRL